MIDNNNTRPRDSRLELAGEPEQSSSEEIDSREKIKESLGSAIEFISDITGGETQQSVTFQKFLKHKNFSDDMDDTSYWHALRTLITVGDSSWLKQQGYSDQDLQSIDLLTFVPILINAQKTLKAMEGLDYKNLSNEDKLKYNDCKRIASTFNDKLRNYVEHNPDIHVEDLEISISDLMDLFVVYYEIENVIRNIIKPTIVGMQNEVAFGQILEGIKNKPEYKRMGFNWRPSTIDEDIGQGIQHPGEFYDYEVTLTIVDKDGKPIITKNGIEKEIVLIDIKSSKTSIENNASIGMISKKPNSNTYIIALEPMSIALAKSGKFYVSPYELEELIPIIYETIVKRDSIILNNNSNRLSS